MTKTLFPAHITAEYLEKNFTQNQFTDTLGLKFAEVGSDFLRARLVVDERHLRPGGIMNGGVSLALIETLGSVACASSIDSEKQNALGLQVSANHLSIARPGDTLTITARPVHTGRTTHIWDVSIENQNQRPVSSGRITLLIV